VFLLAGIAFKISAVPFHMWTPDVYEGAPTPVTAFFAAAPKMAAMALFVRIVIGLRAGDARLAADRGVHLDRLDGAGRLRGDRPEEHQAADGLFLDRPYGLCIVGLAAGSQAGVRGVILYMLIYMVMTLGTFACILAMRRKEDGNVEQIDDLAGLSSTNPFMALMLTILMFSLAGIPPLAGFFGKYFVFVAAIEAKLYGARHYRCAGLGRGSLLLPADHQDHVVRSAERLVCPGCR
jgi:NADH-quinone oxidoreductase subunit N